MAIDPQVQLHIDQIRDHLVSIETKLNEEPEPEPVAHPMASFTLEPFTFGLTVTMTHPALPPEVDYMVVGWGDEGGFLGSDTFDLPFPATYEIDLLDPVPTTVQIGYGTRPIAIPSEHLATQVATPMDVEDPPPPDPTEWPASATWDAKYEWIDGRAGVLDTPRQIVGLNGFVPAGCSWFPTASPPRLDVNTATLLENIEVPGRMFVRNNTTANLTLRNVKGWDVFASGSLAGSNRVILVEDCSFTLPSWVVIDQNWGQGNLNALKPGFVVRRTRLAGASDNVQCSGGGLIEECVFEDMTIDPEFTHNDFIQNYDGLLNVRRCIFEQTLTDPSENNHVNGIFADSSEIDIEDCYIKVTAPAGFNAWAIHAAKEPATVTVRRSFVRGKVIGVTFQEDVDHANGY